MKNKKNSIFLIVVPILCILIVALFAYDRYQTNQLAKKFKQDNQTADTSKNNNQTSLENKLPTIYCVGDSTTIGTSKNTSYPKYLENSINTTITTFGDDSINSLALAIKFGVSEIYVNNFTIPAKSEETTITLLDKNGQAVNAILTSKTNIDKCTINNIEGSINYDTANNRLVFKRSKAGESSKINTLTKIEVTKPEINKDNILILFTGSYEESVQGSLAEYQKQIISAFNTDKYIVVYYTAKVNTDDSVILGDKGNSNDVSLTWKRTNTNYYDILKDKCIVYSYGYDLTKKFSDSKGDATKVKFVVKNKTDNYYLVARADRAGVYQVTGKSAKEADATQFSPSSDGKLVINGIEGDEYGFTETHSDAGYSLLKKEVIIKVKETKADITPTEANITGIQSKSDADSTANDGVPNGAVLKNDVTVQTTAASATVDETKATMTKHDDSGNAYINMQITNQKQFMLPMTGGAGNYLLIIAGVVVAGCGILILNKNRGRSQR